MQLPCQLGSEVPSIKFDDARLFLALPSDAVCRFGGFQRGNLHKVCQEEPDADCGTPMIICKTIIRPPYLRYSTGLQYFCILKKVKSITAPQIASVILPKVVYISAPYHSLLRKYSSGMFATTISAMI